MPGPYETRLFVNGKYVDAQNKQTFALFNPATDDKIADLPIAGKEDVEAAVAAAKAAQPAWEAVPSFAKAAIVRKLADLLVANKEYLGELDSVAMGRPMHGPFGTIGDAEGAKVFLNYWAGLGENIHGQTTLGTPNVLGMVLRQPFGVTAGIIPWNAPILIFLTKVITSILAGNTMILKSSEKAPLSSIFLAKLCKEAGVPDGVVNVLSGLGETGSLLASNMVVRKISFTGSTRTGRLVQQAATNSNLKDVQLELGGKSAGIVWSDADLNSTVKSCLLSFTWNSGQLCSSTTRLYVHKDIAEDFTERLKTAMSNYTHGDPKNKKTTLGPQADAIQGKNVVDYLEAGKAEGKCIIGGKRVGQRGWFIEPTIFVDVPHDAKINKEEVRRSLDVNHLRAPGLQIFGPVVIIHKIETEEEALRLANDTEYGLFGTIYTKDLNRALKFARRLESGTVGVNITSPIILPDLPAGGFKTSGIGREYGADAVLDWTEIKTVLIKNNL